MFEKRHYIVIAEAIAKSENLTEFEDRITQLFQNDSIRFDSWRFAKYIRDIRDANKKPQYTIGRTVKECLEQKREFGPETAFNRYWRDKHAKL